jgi:hypothetical protein
MRQKGRPAFDINGSVIPCYEATRANLLPRRVRKSATELFAIAPLNLAAKAKAATSSSGGMMVWLWLVQQERTTRDKTFPVSTESLAPYGVSYRAKKRALEELEAAGLITVSRHLGKSPVVTVRW